MKRKATDREKIEGVLYLFDVDLRVHENRTITKDRTYYFDDEGVLQRIRELDPSGHHRFVSPRLKW